MIGWDFGIGDLTSPLSPSNRMFSSSLVEELRYLEEDIQAVQDRVDDPVLCQKVEQYVSAPHEIQETFKADASE